jgi:hypothetical protein
MTDYCQTSPKHVPVKLVCENCLCSFSCKFQKFWPDGACDSFVLKRKLRELKEIE